MLHDLHKKLHFVHGMYAYVSRANSSNKLTILGEGLVEELMDAQLTNKFLSLTEPEFVLICSEDSVHGPYPDSTSHSHAIFTTSFNNKNSNIHASVFQVVPSSSQLNFINMSQKSYACYMTPNSP